MKKPFIAATLLVTAATAALAQGISTRYGALTTNNDHLLLFQGRAVTPKVQGNNSLTILKKFELASKDVVLIQDNGGTACPAQYHFVTVTPAGAKATRAFGTCTDLVKATQIGDAIRVEMPGFEGPFATEAALQASMRRRHIFVFKNGQVSETVITRPTQATAFNPFTFYFPVGGRPKGFERFGAFILNKGSRGNGWKNISGALMTDLSNPKGVPLRRIQVSSGRLSFMAPVGAGESFSFSGRFLQRGDLNRFSEALNGKRVIVLEGTSRQLVGGKQRAIAPMKFYVQAGAS